MKHPEATLFLAGGGTPEQSALLDRVFIERVRQTRAALASRVGYVPAALAEKQDRHPYESCRVWFEQTYGSAFTEIELWTDLDSVGTEELRRVGAVYVGGDSDVLLRQLRETGFAERLGQFLDEGGVYYGGSAGAVVLGRDIRTAHEVRHRDAPLVDSFAGLDLLGGYSVFPHFLIGRDGFGLDAVRELSLTLDSPILAIPETSGLVVSGNRFSVVGADPVTACRRGEVEVFQPGEDGVLEFPHANTPE